MSRPPGPLSVLPVAATVLWGGSPQRHIRRAPGGVLVVEMEVPGRVSRYITTVTRFLVIPLFLSGFVPAGPPHSQTDSRGWGEGLGPRVPHQVGGLCRKARAEPGFSLAPPHRIKAQRGVGSPQCAPFLDTSQPALPRGYGWASRALSRRSLCQPLEGPAGLKAGRTSARPAAHGNLGARGPWGRGLRPPGSVPSPACSATFPAFHVVL